MSCTETRELIHAYVDREVELVKSIELEEHLRSCDACTQTYRGIRNLRSTIENSTLRFEPSANFEQRLRSALRLESKPERTPAIVRWRWVMAAASLVAATVVIWAIAVIFTRQSTSELLAQEIVASHVRSLMGDHLTDVPSSDKHTVKPWFNGKLDFSPTVKDLSQQGFTLIGGRLDYISNRPVAALAYQRRQHLINLFVWPSTDVVDGGERASTRQGYSLIRWTSGGMTYWAVSDINLTELQQFVRLLQDQSQARVS